MIRAALMAAILCLSVAASSQNLPDLRGNYYFTLENGQQLSSSIYSSKVFELKSKLATKVIKVNRIIDKLSVQDIVTYFVEVNVQDKGSSKIVKQEMVLVENQGLGRIRMELETGEEWIRFVPTSDTQSVRRG